MLALVFPKINFWMFSFLFFIPVIWDLKNVKNWKQAFIHGLGFGLVFQAVFHNWILELKAFAPIWGVAGIWILFVIYLALFYACAFTMMWIFLKKSFWYISLPAIWIIFEWLRSFGPLANTAGSIGYSQVNFGLILQLASIFGVYGLSFLLILINCFLYILIFEKEKLKFGISLIIILIMIFGYGFLRLKNSKYEFFQSMKVAIIQGNHSQKDKLNMKNRANIRQDYVNLTKSIIKKNPKIVFWPETIVSSLNWRVLKFRRQVLNLAKKGNFWLLFGTPVLSNKKIYNAIIMVEPDEKSLVCYKKEKLMPFGEYVPFRNVMQKLKIDLAGNDFSAGKFNTVIQIGDVKLGAGVCLESIYPSYYRNWVKQDADVLFVLVNNAWFFKSSASWEHLQMSAMRAVENNRYLIQSANTGISAIIDNNGQIMMKSKMDIQTILIGKVKIKLKNSIYFYIGNLIVYLSILWLSIIYIWKWLNIVNLLTVV